MSRSVNKVILIGNLTRDPELRQTASGQSVTTFGMATNRIWKTGDNEKHSSAEFHEVVAWAKLAEICSKFLKKGMLVYVEGYLKTRSWETPEGIKKFRTEIIVQDMIRLEKGNKTENSSEDDDEFVPDDDSAFEDNSNQSSEIKPGSSSSEDFNSLENKIDSLS